MHPRQRNPGGEWGVKRGSWARRAASCGECSRPGPPTPPRFRGAGPGGGAGTSITGTTGRELPLAVRANLIVSIRSCGLAKRWSKEDRARDTMHDSKMERGRYRGHAVGSAGSLHRGWRSARLGTSVSAPGCRGLGSGARRCRCGRGKRRLDASVAHVRFHYSAPCRSQITRSA